MREFAVLFDGGMWHVMEKFPGAQASVIRACESFELAIQEIALLQGGPVLIKVAVESI